MTRKTGASPVSCKPNASCVTNRTTLAWKSPSDFSNRLARETGEQVWLEAIEREVKLSPVPLNAPIKRMHEFTFPAGTPIDGAITRRNEMICGRIELETQAY